MSEMTSVEQHSQQQQYVGGNTNAEHHCKDCGLYFESSKSLEVHLRYHQENLLTQWANQAQQEESNNNNSKAGNHNSHVKRESVTAPADSSESSSRPASAGPTSSQQQSQQQGQQQNSLPSQGSGQQQQQQQQHPASQAYGHFPTPMFSETSYFMQNDQAYLLQQQHHYSPPNDEPQSASNYPSRYHPYHHSSHFPPERTNSVSSTSPRSPPQCDKCGGVFEDANQLAEHMRSNHPTSPSGYQGQQYQQLGSSPQHPQSQGQQQQQQQQAPQPQMHASPPQNSQPPQQSNYDYSTGGAVVKNEIKQEQEEQAEILDLDSHKVQTHRYEEELMRLHQQQEMQMQLHHHQQQQALAQQRGTTHSVSSMLGWPPAQPHDYHPGISPMAPMDSVSPIPDQRQFMPGQHLPVEPPRHAVSPIITSTQPMPGHQMPGNLLPQPTKGAAISNQSWKSNEARRPKTYNCTACNKWFTSSGHLKRHYNTTLHKNAVKQSNQPDPANMPISAHHHPGRDSGGSGRGGPPRSPELSTSGSPPNLMAGPSVEAARGLLNTPTNLYTTSNSSNGSSNSNDSTTSMGHQQQQQQQLQAVQQHQVQSPQQGQSTAVQHMANTQSMVALNSPVQSPMAVHHHQQMGSPSPQLSQHHLQIGSPSHQIQHHHPMNSPMSPMHPPPPPQSTQHLNSPSPMPVSSHHHMNSPSPIIQGVSPMVSPPIMGGTTMPHQPYPNALPPHVTTTTSIPGLLESITNQLITTGDLPNTIQFNQQQSQDNTLPSFGTFSNHQRPLPSFTQFGITGFLVSHNQPQAINVGGLSPEDNTIPHEKSFESNGSNYEHFGNSPPRYESLNNMDTSVHNTDGMIIKQYEVLQHHNNHHMRDYRSLEANNNLPQRQGKEEVNPNIVKREVEEKKLISTKEHQVTSTNTGSHYISQDGFHKCIECDKVFNKACYLTQHNKSFHSGDKPFKCNQCGKRFPHEYLHAEHLQKHAGDKPYKCEICPKQFNHKTDLRRHMCLHTGEKPYACDTCGKGFIRKDHMMKHLDTHKKKTNSHNIHLRA